MVRPIDRFYMLPEEKQRELVEGDDYVRRAVAGPHQKYPAMYAQDYFEIDWEDDWSILLFHSCRGSGKDLDDDTEICTPGGWSRIADLRVGDVVYDEEGRECSVTGVYPQGLKEVMRVEFGDGSEIVAGEGHLWVTLTNAERLRRRKYGLGMKDWASVEIARSVHDGYQSFRMVEKEREPVTTLEISETLTYGSRGDRNHCVPLAGALSGRFRVLPIDPYVLGLWLGDGDKGAASVSCDAADEPHYGEMVRGAGEHWRVTSVDKRTGVLRCGMGGAHVDRQRMRKRLSGLGVLGNKHVPEVYMRASLVQRLSLLRGLMDSDGSISSAMAEFSNTNRRLAESVLELVRTLGGKPVLSEGRAKLNGEDKGPKYRVAWRALPDMNPFSLPRKARLVRSLGSQGSRHSHRMIAAVERLGKRSTTCISVDSPNRLFLAGRALVPTHNTLHMSWFVDKAVHEWGVRRMLYAGATSGDVIDTNVNGDDGILACSRTEAQFTSLQHGKPQIRWANGAICRIGYPGTPTTIRGGSNELVICDEFAFWEHCGERTTADPLTMIQPTLRRGRSRLMIATTPNVDSPLANRELLRIGSLPGSIVRTVDISQVTHIPEWRKEQMVSEFGGVDGNGSYMTFMGRQELGGEIIIDPGTVVWVDGDIEKARLAEGEVPKADEFDEILISVDPSRKSKDASDPTGLVVLGRRAWPKEPSEIAAWFSEGKRQEVQIVVLAARDGRWPPDELARQVKIEQERWGECGMLYGLVEDNVTGEHFGPSMRNFGVDISWEYISADATTGDKRLRAMDALAQYRLGVVKHVPGLQRLEHQQRLFTGVKRTQGVVPDDMVDALSQGVNWLSKAPAQVMTMQEFAMLYAQESNPDSSRERSGTILAEGLGVFDV